MPTSPRTFLQDFQRYATLLQSTLANSPKTFTPETESATAIQVERALAYPAALLDPKSPGDSIDLLLGAPDNPDPAHLASFTVIDRTGHHRPHYRGLLFYAAFQTFHLAYETLPTAAFGKWEEGLRPWADMLESQLTQFDPTPRPDSHSTETESAIGNRTSASSVESQSATPSIPAQKGSAATDAAWQALALHVAGKLYVRDAWTDLASDLFGKLTKSQQPTGAFLATTPADNPETQVVPRADPPPRRRQLRRPGRRPPPRRRRRQELPISSDQHPARPRHHPPLGPLRLPLEPRRPLARRPAPPRRTPNPSPALFHPPG